MKQVEEAFVRITGVPDAWTNLSLSSRRASFIAAWDAVMNAIIIDEDSTTNYRPILNPLGMAKDPV
jgi:hypothetical protein